VGEPQSIIYVSGQGLVSADGTLVGAGDFDTQVGQALENPPRGAAIRWRHPRSRYADEGLPHGHFQAAQLRPHQSGLHSRAPGSLNYPAVGALAIPGMMIDVEAVAVL
jgi:hypothetical protein